MFVVILNFLFQINHGFEFESDTDTEVISKLIKHIHNNNPDLSFRELVEQVIQQLVSLIFFFFIFPCILFIPKTSLFYYRKELLLLYLKVRSILTNVLQLGKIFIKFIKYIKLFSAY